MEEIKLNDSRQNSSVHTKVLKNSKTVSELQSNNGATFQFTIPTLKGCKNGQKLFEDSPEANTSSSNINQFLMKQLGDQQSDRFNVPTLRSRISKPYDQKSKQTNDDSNHDHDFVIPLLKNTKPFKICQNANNITAIRHDQFNSITTHDQEQHTDIPKSEDHIIDLTTALSSTRISSSRNESTNQRNRTESETFEIPFIECDRQQLKPQIDDYCQIDVSQVQFQHSLASPSTLGRILSNNVKRRKHVNELQTQQLTFKAKHKIERFLFDTKSPDDLIVAALNRFTRSQ